MANPFTNSHDHLLAELRWLDCLLGEQVRRAREDQGDEPGDSLAGLFVSGREVERLVTNGPAAAATAFEEKADSIRAEIDEREAASVAEGVILTLPYTADVIGLTSFESKILLLAVASEIDPKYERLFGYLQDDMSRQRPTVGLALRLFCRSDAERLAARVAFSDQATLFRTLVLRPLSGGDAPLPSRLLIADDMMVNFLLGVEGASPGLAASFQRHPPARQLDSLRWAASLKDGLLRLIKNCVGTGQGVDRRLVIHLWGPRGTGRKALAAALCEAADAPLFVVDARELARRFENFDDALRRVFRHALLNQGAVFLDHFEALADDEAGAGRRRSLGRVVAEASWLTFIGTEADWSPEDLFHPHAFVSEALPAPGLGERESLWKELDVEPGRIAPEIDWDEIAAKFRLTPGAMAGALGMADSQSRRRGMDGGPITSADLHRGCQAQSSGNLARLARKLTPRYTWPDLVLPANALEQLHEVCHQVRQRGTVYTSWGFGPKQSLGKGLCVLLHGHSGVGKTMAVEVVANDLQLVVYKIDLSTVVSKYIGETEKNLGKIFHEAESSNSLLFFDEADALFGKRTEVKDAHDRYANIEVNYLLQRIEEFEGLVVLASNMRKNIDDSFFRRMHFAIEFPLPDVGQRYRIWMQHIPPAAPLADDVDFNFLANRFPLAGGNIRNVVVNAAFLAASNGREIRMAHLVRATRREYEKLGRLCTDVEFAPYHRLLTEA